jgi:hypothetical protein
MDRQRRSLTILGFAAPRGLTAVKAAAEGGA